MVHAALNRSEITSIQNYIESTPMQRIFVIAAACLALSSGSAVAQNNAQEQDGIGLELEELISEKGTVRLEFGTFLVAARRSGVSGLYQSVQTGTGSFVSVPVTLGTTDRQSETMLLNLGLRYGVSERAELYSRATFRYESSRFTDTTTALTDNNSDGGFQSLVFGMNYRLSDDAKTPGIVGFADITVLEDTSADESDYQSAKSGTVGFTMYRVLDPVVLSLTAGYRANFDRAVGSDDIDPGDTFFLNPSVGFAVNNELTLTGGLGLNITGVDQINGVDEGTRRTQADLQFGAAYAWDKNTILRSDIRAEVLGENTVTLGLNVTRKLGRTN